MAAQLNIDDVLVDLSGNVRCQVICPFSECGHVSKLGVLKQSNELALTKFNAFNFERHFQSQHMNKKRKVFDDITNTNHNGESDDGLENQIRVCREKIQLLEEENSELKRKQKSQSSTSHDFQNDNETLRSTNSQLQNEISLLGNQQPQQNMTATTSDQIVKLEEEICKLKSTAHDLINENISLRHEVMDVHGTIRAVCRIKPGNYQQCYQIEISDDWKSLKLCKYY